MSFLTLGTNAFAQTTTKKRPDTAGSNTYTCSIIPPAQCDRVQNKGNANDTSETTAAVLQSYGGTAVGIGNYNSLLTLGYTNTADFIPANSKFYLKINSGETGLLDALLGGGLGNLLKGVLGVVIGGEHVTSFDLKDGSGTSVINVSTSNSSTNQDKVTFATDATGTNYYAVFYPKQAVKTVEVQDLTSFSLLFGGTNSFSVFDSYYYNNVSLCDIPLLTSYTASGGLLGVLSSAPVTNANRAIDNDVQNTYSTIGITSLLNLGTASTIEQYFHLPTKVSNKSVKITMQMPASLLKLTIADQSSVVFYSDGVEVGSVKINGSTLGLDLLGLVNATGDKTFSFAAAPRNAAGNIIPFDKVGIRINIPVSVDLLGGSNIRVYDFAAINDKPVVTKVCTKEFITNGIRETKFDITHIIPNYNAANSYTVRDINGNSINPVTNKWQPLGSYIVRGITGSTTYCSNEDVSITAIQDTRYKINGKVSISMPLDANDDGTADAQHTFLASDYKIIDFNNQNADITSQYGPIKIYDENTLLEVTGTLKNYSQIGSYNYYVKATNLANPDCDLVRRVTVYVYDKAECEYRYNQLMANKETAQTVTLLGIPLGGTSQSARAVDTDASTHGSVFNVVSLLGIGTTSQDLLFQTSGVNKTIAAGTPLTIKLGQDYNAVQVLGGITLRALGTNGSPVGPLLSVDEFDLANVLVGDNVFEYTFIPKDNNGVAVAYSGVRVNLGSVLGVGNSLKVYGAYIDERIAVANATCNPNIVVTGAETRIGTGTEETLLLNTSTRDVFWGVQDAGLGVATLLSSINYPYYSADAINAPGTPLHGTPNYNTGTLFNASVGALNTMSVTVKFKEIARPGDKVRIVLGKDDLSILDANVLGSSLTVQRYMGAVAIGDPVVVQASSIIKLDLLSLINSQTTGKYAYMLEGIGAPFDRVEVKVGNVVNLQLLAPKLRIYDVSLLPYFDFDSDNGTTLLCTSAPFEIEKMDPCTSYELSYAYPTVVGGNITAWNDITGSQVPVGFENADKVQYRLQMRELFKAYNQAGTLYMKVVTKRQGCNYGDAQYLKVKIAACGSIVNPMIRTRLKSN